MKLDAGYWILGLLLACTASFQQALADTNLTAVVFPPTPTSAGVVTGAVGAVDSGGTMSSLSVPTAFWRMTDSPATNILCQTYSTGGTNTYKVIEMPPGLPPARSDGSPKFVVSTTTNLLDGFKVRITIEAPNADAAFVKTEVEE